MAFFGYFNKINCKFVKLILETHIRRSVTIDGSFIAWVTQVFIIMLDIMFNHAHKAKTQLDESVSFPALWEEGVSTLTNFSQEIKWIKTCYSSVTVLHVLWDVRVTKTMISSGVTSPSFCCQAFLPGSTPDSSLWLAGISSSCALSWYLTGDTTIRSSPDLLTKKTVTVLLFNWSQFFVSYASRAKFCLAHLNIFLSLHHFKNLTITRFFKFGSQ